MEFTLHEFEHDPSVLHFGLEVAAAVGVEAERVFKTLVVAADSKLGVGIVAVDRQLSMKSLAVVLGAKRCELADQAMAERVTGYVRGGISPFGQKKRLPTVLDLSGAEFATILVSGGRRGLEIEIAPADLVRTLGAKLAAISA